jgi:hypothetical protein
MISRKNGYDKNGSDHQSINQAGICIWIEKSNYKNIDKIQNKQNQIISCPLVEMISHRENDYPPNINNSIAVKKERG